MDWGSMTTFLPHKDSALACTEIQTGAGHFQRVPRRPLYLMRSIAEPASYTIRSHAKRFLRLTGWSRARRFSKPPTNLLMRPLPVRGCSGAAEPFPPRQKARGRLSASLIWLAQLRAAHSVCRRLRSTRTASNVSSRKRTGSRSPALAKVTRWLAATCATGHYDQPTLILSMRLRTHQPG